MKDVFVVEREIPYEGSAVMAVFMTLEDAKTWVNELLPVPDVEYNITRANQDHTDMVTYRSDRGNWMIHNGNYWVAE